VGFKFFKKRFFHSRTPKQQVLSLSQPPEANHAGLPDISANIDLCVANWYSPAKEIIDFSYCPNFKKVPIMVRAGFFKGVLGTRFGSLEF